MSAVSAVPALLPFSQALDEGLKVIVLDLVICRVLMTQPILEEEVRDRLGERLKRRRERSRIFFEFVSFVPSPQEHSRASVL
ncbi:hypothetical protein F5X97DRAFT_329130 [Nemania serpens]|nr:hypothetical protein F5X97DRAFT_329130 [Nemania serpens]